MSDTIILTEEPSVISLTELLTEVKELPQEYTRIDFIHFADPIYINGGWVRIEPQTFIRPVGTNDRLYILQAVNVPLAPAKHNYRHISDSLAFSLFFPALPKSVTAIDIVENEGGADSFFNFYGISVERIKAAPIKIYNFRTQNPN